LFIDYTQAGWRRESLPGR